MQIEKALINDHLLVSEDPENFAFQLFIILKQFTRKIRYFLKN